MPEERWADARLSSGLIPSRGWGWELREGAGPAPGPLPQDHKSYLQNGEPSMKQFFYPKSVAVVGVSENPDNLGRNIISNLVEFGFQGKIFPVGPKGGRVFDLDIFPSLLDLPEPPELVAILAPARVVPDILADCGRLGVKRVVVESGGFSELGREGRKLEDQVRQQLREHQIRMMGPNGLGIINMEIGLCLPFMTLPGKPHVGGVSLICQSGGVGSNVIAWLAQSGIGMNKFVSVGNKLDTNENDILAFLLEDPGTTLIYLYMEDLADGRRLMELGRQAKKPILLHKANIGSMSADIARSHTASLAVDDEVVSAACCQSGILRVHSRNEFLHAAIALQQPPLKGDRLVVLSRSGGEAVVVADACQKAGFQLPPLSPEIVRLIESRSRAGVIKPINPLDLGDIFDFSLYSDVAAAFCQDPEVDAIILNYGPINDLEREPAQAMAKKLIDLARQHQKPLLITVIGNLEERQFFRQELGVPVFSFPGEAIRALILARSYNVCQLLPPPAAPTEVASLPAIDRVLAPHLATPGPLPLPVALEVVQTLGIPVPLWQLVTSAAGAEEAAASLGLPVCLKLSAPSALHKSDLGGVLLNLNSPSRGPGGLPVPGAGGQHESSRRGGLAGPGHAPDRGRSGSHYRRQTGPGLRPHDYLRRRRHLGGGPGRRGHAPGSPGPDRRPGTHRRNQDLQDPQRSTGPTAPGRYLTGPEPGPALRPDDALPPDPGGGPQSRPGLPPGPRHPDPGRQDHPRRTLMLQMEHRRPRL